MRFLLTAVVAALLVSFLAIPARPANAQSQPQAQLDVTKITPSMVDGSSPGEMTITGKLTNTSDRRISNLHARVERGNPAESESGAQQALQGNVKMPVQSRFQPLPGELAPGQQIPFEVHMPITGPDSLQMAEQGVYPMMLNINGTPRGGSDARVAEGRFLLPVLAPPGGAQQPPGHPPTPTSMLLPIVDYPRMQQKARPGMPTVLADDQLTGSMQPGGRLFNLVKGLHDGLPPGSPLTSSVCFAIDPDLLETASAMQSGYEVRQPNGSTRPGSGSDAAKRWLGELKDVTKGRCAIQLPYADADVAALARAGLPDLVKGSLDSYSTNLMKRTLDVEPRTDVAWPISGALNTPAAKTLAGDGMRTALMRPEALTTPNTSLRPSRLRETGTSVLPIDPLLSNAMDPLREDNPSATAPSPPDSGALSTENTLGALAFRGTGGFEPNTTSVLAPPRHWNLGGADVVEMLSGMERLTKAGYIKPTPLPEPKPNTAQPAGLSYPTSASGAEIPQPVLQKLAKQNFKVGDLFRSSSKDPQVNLEPADVTSPLRNGLLHGASSAWRGNPGAAEYWVSRATNTVNETLQGVQVAKLQPITLANSNTRIPVAVNNQLPITVYVLLRAPAPTGVDIQTRTMDRLRIPARGARQVWVPANVQRPGSFSLNISAKALSGTELGPPTQLQVESNTYGLITKVITVVAGVLLFVLSGRRIIRRIRNSRAKRKGSASTADPTNPVDPTQDTIEIVTTESDRNPS